MSARVKMLSALLALSVPALASAQEEPGPVYDASEVAPARGLKFEVRAGIAMPEQASRLRITNPAVGAGFSMRPLSRLRLDGGYGFT